MMTCGLAACLLAQPTVAGQLEDAKAAYIRGDDATGMKLLRPLAEQGNSDSQRLLGMVYCLGFGVPIDNVEGAKWYLKAADQGNSLAQYELGGHV
jgi:TPR repeat protein